MAMAVPPRLLASCQRRLAQRQHDSGCEPERPITAASLLAHPAVGLGLSACASAPAEETPSMTASQCDSARLRWPAQGSHSP
eukprot:15434968-Alexandrium_andersonii.AAC.1